jgi:anaerobic selenocysteine-containing dehydrogenase
VALHPEHAEDLGFKDGDKVAIGGEDLELHVKLFVKDEVPKGGAVISLGFSDFPLTRALDGSRCRGIELSLAKE